MSPRIMARALQARRTSWHSDACVSGADRGAAWRGGCRGPQATLIMLTQARISTVVMSSDRPCTAMSEPWEGSGSGGGAEGADEVTSFG